MEIETFKTFLTVASIALSFYFGTKTANRNSIRDYSEDKTHVARLDAGLDEISRDVKDIKSDMVRMRDSVNDVSVKGRSMETQVNHISSRVDKLEDDVRKLKDNCGLHKGGD